MIERTYAKQFMNSLEPLRDVHPTITLQLVYALLIIAYEESLTGTDLAARCAIGPSVTSRQLKVLGAHGGGLGLVALTRGLLGDNRQWHIVLTPKGAALIRAMIYAFKNGAPRRKRKPRLPRNTNDASEDLGCP